MDYAPPSSGARLDAGPVGQLQAHKARQSERQAMIHLSQRLLTWSDNPARISGTPVPACGSISFSFVNTAEVKGPSSASDAFRNSDMHHLCPADFQWPMYQAAQAIHCVVVQQVPILYSHYPEYEKQELLLSIANQRQRSQPWW